MSIKISKVESNELNNNVDPILHTNLYGDINKKFDISINDVDPTKFSYFDTFDGWALFVDKIGNTFAVKEENTFLESLTIDNINDEIENIKNKYQIEKIEWVEEGENSIMIKASSDVISNIFNDYKDNNNYKPEKATDNVLFLLVDDYNIELDEDDDLLNHLDDNTIKDIASKTGTKLSGSESKDELKGIIKGALNSK